MFLQSPQSPWTTANNLHSDFISDFAVAGNQLLISSYDAGIARRDLSGNFWLATWNSGNWLSSNDVYGMTFVNNEVQILTVDTVHIYNTNSGTFSTSMTLDSLSHNPTMLETSSIGLHQALEAQQMILYWLPMVVRFLAMLEPGNSPMYTGDFVIGSGPSSGDMSDAMQFNGMIYVGSESYLDRYSISQSRWLSAIDMGSTVSQIVNDGVNVFVGTLGSGVHIVDAQGNVLDTWDTNDGLQSNEISGLDVEGDWVVSPSARRGFCIQRVNYWPRCCLD